MNCPNCGKMQDQNFCGNCGTKLKEKCPKCGEMEWIGRPSCYVDYKKTDELWSKAREKNQDLFYFLTVVINQSIVTLCLWKGLHDMSDLRNTYIWVAVACAFALLCVYYIVKKLDDLRKKAEAKFWAKHPELKPAWDEWHKWLKA